MTLDCNSIHHDGSAQFVDNLSPRPGEDVRIRVRVPRALTPERVWVRTIHDGEPKMVVAEVELETAHEVWWCADLPILNSRSHYRWGFSGGNVGYGWLTAAGWVDHDVTDAFDFAISTAPMPPEWSKTAVVYQIYPDRFASSGATYELPDWAVAREWDLRPEGRSPNSPREYFGGDLPGVTSKLSHLEELGANVVYFTPFFPAGSTHRYDASTFRSVDPLLGGDEGLIELVDAAHERGMRVMGDITDPDHQTAARRLRRLGHARLPRQPVRPRPPGRPPEPVPRPPRVRRGRRRAAPGHRPQRHARRDTPGAALSHRRLLPRPDDGSRPHDGAGLLREIR